MFVYRVENKDGTGPYDAGAFCPYERCSYKTKSGKYVDRHPSPQEDGIKGRTPDHYYGFQNIMQLDVWFRRLPSGLESLREKNFHIAVYHCPRQHVLIGKKQVAFKLEFATRLRVLPLLSERKRREAVKRQQAAQRIFQQIPF
jgi:hypothetical protein